MFNSKGGKKGTDRYASMDFYSYSRVPDKPVSDALVQRARDVYRNTAGVSEEVVQEDEVSEVNAVSIEELDYQVKIARRTGMLIGGAVVLGVGIVYALVT